MWTNFESSPARGGETEPPPPRGSRCLRARARHFTAQGEEVVFRPRARAEPRARARHRARSAAARGEHLGPGPAGGEDRRLDPRHARAGSAAGQARRAVPVSAATQGLVRFPVWRARLVLSALGAGFALLAGRALYLQAVEPEFLRGKGDARYSRLLEVPATRGRIVDRRGDALAISTPVKSIWAIPGDVELSGAQRRKLAALLGVEIRELQKKLDESARDFVYLKRQVSPDTGDAIAALGLRGVYQHREFRRYYPGGEVTAHLVGFTGVDDAGQEGIELAFQSHPAGTPGTRRLPTDRLGPLLEGLASIRAAQGARALVPWPHRRPPR